MSDADTLAVYERMAADYADRFATGAAQADAPAFSEFAAALPKQGRVLDLGCGPGHWAAGFRDAGFKVDATDASSAMAAEAKARFGLNVTVSGFAALTAKGRYDGIWANFSLLHVPKAELPDHLARIHSALKSGGVFHLGTKLGTGEARDELGRFYSYYSEGELKDLLTTAGFTIIQSRRGEEAGLAGSVDPYILVLSHA